ncbi:MAG: Lrp/AsnC family transcriptional regulator [Nitrososphaera sp.]|uniref:Lrp/AsnC family transcriptional regulator n=1 Tax=Nitrososphaera sp. TaxID=1971748 RepID=UPI0017FDD4B1|nr:Lrp/AsnC family transcriptional regulator [Nitrososphaera sp.]NWG37593.1 Lrp/AsnC family transcriptional regulator [Nitrososphaera sp.]
MKADLDALDLRLVETLQKDSSMPFVDIADRLGVTEGTVRNRVRRLRRLGVIRRFTVSVDPLVLGQSVVAFVLLNAVNGRLNEVAKKLSSLDAVAEVHETHTYGDLLLKVRAKSASDLAGIISNDIKGVPGVAGTQVLSVLNVWKDSP